MSTELFSIPPTTPPLTMRVHLARVAVEEAEKAYDELPESVESFRFETFAWSRVLECRRQLAVLETELLNATKGSL